MIGPLKSVELSVVVPAHNSSAVVEDTVSRLTARLRGRPAEIIVVENGSTDDTFDRCRRLAGTWQDPNVALVVLQSQRGMGNALRAGVLASRGESVLLTADDLPFGFDDLDAADALEAAGQSSPVLIGSKAHPDSRVERGLLRDTLTHGFAVLRRIILGMRTGDPQGTILMDGILVRNLADQLAEQGFLFTTELIYRAEQLGIRPVEVPVRLSDNHASHRSRVSRTDVVAMGVGLLRLRRRRHDIRRQQTTPAKSWKLPQEGMPAGNPDQDATKLSITKADVGRIFGGLLLSGLFLYLTLVKTSPQKALDGLLSLSAPLVAVALGLCLVEVGIRAVRWRFLLRTATSVSLVNSYLYICIGHFANTLLPFRLGDAARAYLAGGRFGANRMTVLGTIVIERLADGLMLLAIVTLGVFLGVGVGTDSRTVLLMAVATTVAALAIMATFRQSMIVLLTARVPRLMEQASALAVAFRAVRNPETLGVVLATTAASFAASVLILHVVLGAAGVSLEWWQTAIAIGVMTLSTAIPAAPGALGTYEFAGTTALAVFNVPAHTALAAVVAVHLLATLPPAIIGMAATAFYHLDVLGIRNHEAGTLSPQPAVARAD